VGPDPQTKEGNLIIEGVLRLGQFTTADAPSGTEGALYYDTTENTTKLYSNSTWGELGGGWDGIIPNYTTAQRDALSPSSGMMIYNTDYDQIQTYTKTAWSGITGNKALGIECASAMDCASGFCVDSVCCDTSVENCNGDCEACNLAGKMGVCSVFPAGDAACPICQRCDGVTRKSCVNYTNNTQDTGCAGTCQACQNGACSVATAGTDPGNLCAEIICVFVNSVTNQTCNTVCTGKSGNTGLCTGTGTCAANHACSACTKTGIDAAATNSNRSCSVDIGCCSTATCAAMNATCCATALTQACGGYVITGKRVRIHRMPMELQMLLA